MKIQKRASRPRLVALEMPSIEIANGPLICLPKMSERDPPTIVFIVRQLRIKSGERIEKKARPARTGSRFALK